MGPLLRVGKGIIYNLTNFFSKSKILVDIIKNFIQQIAYLVYNTLKSVLFTLWRSVVFVLDRVVKRILLLIISTYFFLFEMLLRILKPLGILGELVFTIYGLVWLLWPLYLAYRMEEVGYWVICVAVTSVLIVKGRQVIIKNGN